MSRLDALPTDSVTGERAIGRPWEQIRKPLVANDLRIKTERAGANCCTGSTANVHQVDNYAIACAGERDKPGASALRGAALGPERATTRARLGVVFTIALRESTIRSA